MTYNPRPPQSREYSPFKKLSGRWGGWVHYKKLKEVGRRMARRVSKMLLHKDTNQ